MTADLEIDDCSSLIVKLKKQFSSLIQVEVEPVGQWFHKYEYTRAHWHLGDSSNDLESDSSDEDEIQEVEIEDDIQYLRSLDPANWKNQDHYAVLGLKKYRYRATDDDIKKSYRVMVLRHHPDKRKGAGEEIREDDDYFTCITKAYEILGVPSKRMSYDSVDSEFDDEIPSAGSKSKANFFPVFRSVFEQNARWSTTRKHTPLLGGPDDSREKVERFYNFWYDFDSWREFSYLDEEEKEKGQDREERRWIEKQNKAERARRRKEEMNRIRKLVDNAYACDPRIAKFKELDREKRAAIKKAKQDAIKQRQEEEEKRRRKIEDEERRIREAAEAEIKAKQEIERKEREGIKKAFKKERKSLRTRCRDRQYYTEDEDERVEIMTDIEYLCEALELTSIQNLNKRLIAISDDRDQEKGIIMEEISKVKKHVEKEIESTTTSKNIITQNGECAKKWEVDDIQLLIKAVNLFPAGTNKRWEVVAEYLNQHSTLDTSRKAKEVLQKAKQLQSSDQHMKEVANKNAFSHVGKSAAQSQPSSINDSTASQRFETPQEMLGVNLLPWATDEQRLLEQALKTYPTSTAERWDRIAECVPNRSKKECMKRYKELVEMVKAKKAATAAANAKK